jgi:hypothetical protein
MTRRLALRWLPVLAALAAMLMPAQSLWAQTAGALFPLGSRLGLVPPPGMVLSQTFQGFEDTQNNVFIRVIAMPEQAYAEIEKTMTNPALKKQGMTVEKRESFALSASKGVLIVARQEANDLRFRKWLLIAPVANLTALVSVEVSDAAKDAYSAAAIRAALASLTHRPIIPVDEQLSMVPFRIGNLAGLRLARVVPGVAVQLTDGPKDDFEAIKQPHLVISVAQGGPQQSSDRDSFARLALGGGMPPFKDVHILGSETMRIGGQPGHEMRAEAKDAKTGTEVEIVQWLRFGTGAYLRIIGFAPKQSWTPTFTRFRAVRDGLEPR